MAARTMPMGRRFQPGQSGNPAGVPKELVQVRAWAREHSEAAIRALAAIMVDPKAPAAARVSAAVAILDRAWGKPAVQVNATMHRPVTMLTDVELVEIVERARDVTGTA